MALARVSGASHAADGVELVRSEAAEIVFGEASFGEEGGEDEREDGVAVVVLAIDLSAALGEPALQFPRARTAPESSRPCPWLPGRPPPAPVPASIVEERHAAHGV